MADSLGRVVEGGGDAGVDGRLGAGIAVCGRGVLECGYCFFFLSSANFLGRVGVENEWLTCPGEVSRMVAPVGAGVAGVDGNDGEGEDGQAGDIHGGDGLIKALVCTPVRSVCKIEFLATGGPRALFKVSILELVPCFPPGHCQGVRILTWRKWFGR